VLEKATVMHGQCDLRLPASTGPVKGKFHYAGLFGAALELVWSRFEAGSELNFGLSSSFLAAN